MPDKIILKNIVDIRSGYLFRERLNRDPQGNVAVIQLRDVNADGVILSKDLIKVKETYFKGDDFLKLQDVIFKAKSTYRIAAVYSENEIKTVASAHYFILRNTSEKILPEYLAWFLNQEPAQRYFDTHARGTRVPIINKASLENLQITIPDLRTQEKIVAVSRLSIRERDLLEEFKTKREQLIKASLLEAVNR